MIGLTPARHRVIGRLPTQPDASASSTPDQAASRSASIEVTVIGPLRWRLTFRGMAPEETGSRLLATMFGALDWPRPTISAVGARPTPNFRLSPVGWGGSPPGRTIEIDLPPTDAPSVLTDLYCVAVPAGIRPEDGYFLGTCTLLMAPVAASTPPSPQIDYAAKDYAGFRTVFADWISRFLPTWQNRDAADPGVMLVELLAYAADYLSYQQDAVATEAYLATSRLRRSVQRHARLLGFTGGNGVGSRVWLAMALKGPAEHVLIPASTSVGAGPDPGGGTGPRLAGAAAGRTVYETMEQVTVWRWRNQLSIFDWGQTEFHLAEGATSCVLEVPHRQAELGGIAAGELLIFQQIRQAPGQANEPLRHHVVRVRGVDTIDAPSTDASRIVVIWYAADALPFAFPVKTTSTKHGPLELAVVKANCVLADLGRTCDAALMPDETLGPGLDVGNQYSPQLIVDGNLVWHSPWDAESARTQPAAAAFSVSTSDALPAVTLTTSEEVWSPRTDLLSSSASARHFVVETDEGGGLGIRFGNDINGRRPSGNSRFRAKVRVAPNPSENIGQNAIRPRLGLDQADRTDHVEISFNNPLAAQGGTPALSTDAIRRAAPAVRRMMSTCFTLTDYARAAEACVGVAEAVALDGWTGAWPVVIVYVRRKQGFLVDTEFRARVRAVLNERCVAGRSIAVLGPVPVPVSGTLNVRLTPSAVADVVRDRLVAAIGGGWHGGGFFAADRWRFGQTLFASDIVAAAMAVPGIADAWLTGLTRADHQPAASPVFAVTVAANEIIQSTLSASAQEGAIVLRLLPAEGREVPA